MAARGAWRIAADECRRHPWRTLLVAQGMVWSVALIVVPAAVIGGSRREAIERAGELGTDLLQIEPSPGLGELAAPREEDLPPLRALLGPAAVVSGLRVEEVEVSGETAWWVGADADHLRARRRTLAAGAWPAPLPRPDGALEVALEAPLAAALGADGALGARLRLRWPVGAPGRPSIEPIAAGAPAEPPAPARRDLVVVGIVAGAERAGIDRFGLDSERAFTEVVHELMATLGVSPRPVPYLEGGRAIFVDRTQVAGTRLDWILLRADPTTIDATERAVSELLIARGRAPLIYSNAAWSIISRPELDGYLALHHVFFWLSTGVGLAVLANLLLLAGTQRRREIALRRAEGALRRDISAQFLCEGVILAALGTLLGVLAGMGIAWIRAELDPNVLIEPDWPWRTIVEGSAILIGGALLVAAIPAWRASRHAPVELLRRV